MYIVEFRHFWVVRGSQFSPLDRSPVGFANHDLHQSTRVPSSKSVSCDESRHLIAVDSSLFRLGVWGRVTTQRKSLCILSESSGYASKALIRAMTRRTAGESTFPTITAYRRNEIPTLIFWTLTEKPEIIQEIVVGNSISELLPEA